MTVKFIPVNEPEKIVKLRVHILQIFDDEKDYMQDIRPSFSINTSSQHSLLIFPDNGFRFYECL